MRNARPKDKRRLSIHFFGTACSCLCVLASGCASTKGYWIDRGRDAADIVTVTGGIVNGAKVQAGPVAAGLIMQSDVVGLRGGEIFAVQPGQAQQGAGADFWTPIPIYIAYDDTLVLGWRSGFSTWSLGEERNKTFYYESKYPFWIGGQTGSIGEWRRIQDGPSIQTNAAAKCETRKSGWSTPLPYQLEVSGGLVFGLRLGFNVGELVDFVVGWFGFDIFDDDLEANPF